jgi:hypothetical protein
MQIYLEHYFRSTALGPYLAEGRSHKLFMRGARVVTTELLKVQNKKFHQITCGYGLL